MITADSDFKEIVRNRIRKMYKEIKNSEERILEDLFSYLFSDNTVMMACCAEMQ